MTIQTVGDLLEELQYLDADTPVFFAHQPSYPFEYSIGGVVETVEGPYGTEEIGDLHHEISDPDTDADRKTEIQAMLAEQDAQAKPVVYLVEGSQTRYLPGSAAEDIGWR